MRGPPFGLVHLISLYQNSSHQSLFPCYWNLTNVFSETAYSDFMFSFFKRCIFRDYEALIKLVTRTQEGGRNMYFRPYWRWACTSSSCITENVIFHFHGIQRFKINLEGKPYSTHKSVLLLFSLLLSLAHMLRSLLPLYFHVVHLRKSWPWKRNQQWTPTRISIN